MSNDASSLKSAPPASDTAFARLGGEAGLRAIVDAFVERLLRDPMVGFFFAKVPARRLKALEYAYAADHLGGPKSYRGRPLDEAHRAHPISLGHYQRRRLLLAQVLAEHHVPLADARAWIAHQDAHKFLVVRPKESSPCPADV